jgi:hypothetical protein
MSLWTKKEQKTKTELTRNKEERKRPEQFLRAWHSCAQSGLWKQQIIKQNLDLRTKFWFSFAMNSRRILCQRSWKLKPISYFCSQLKQVATVRSTLCRNNGVFHGNTKTASRSLKRPNILRLTSPCLLPLAALEIGIIQNPVIYIQKLNQAMFPLLSHSIVSSFWWGENPFFWEIKQCTNNACWKEVEL